MTGPFVLHAGCSHSKKVPLLQPTWSYCRSILKSEVTVMWVKISWVVGQKDTRKMCASNWSFSPINISLTNSNQLRWLFLHYRTFPSPWQNFKSLGKNLSYVNRKIDLTCCVQNCWDKFLLRVIRILSVLIYLNKPSMCSSGSSAGFSMSVIAFNAWESNFRILRLTPLLKCGVGNKFPDIKVSMSLSCELWLRLHYSRKFQLIHSLPYLI